MPALRLLTVLCAVAVAEAAIAAPRQVLTVPAPPSSVEDPPVPAEKGLRTVYLNFDGVTLTASSTADNSQTNTSFILSIAHAPGTMLAIAPFATSDLADDFGLTRSALIAKVVADLYTIHDPYNIDFVTTRPASGNYQMVVIGSDCNTVQGTTCAGVAVLDCSDPNPRNIGYAFPPGLDVDELVVTIAQEMAHAFGLNHTNDTDDIMFPMIQDPLPNSYGSGPIPPGDMACGGAATQNSHALLLATVGFRGQDTTDPDVSIGAPADMALLSGPTTVTVSASDDVEVDRVELRVNGALVDSDTTAPYEFQLAEPDIGEHSLQATAFDTSDNFAVDTITVYAGECVLDDDCEAGFECDGQLCVMSSEMQGQLGDPCVGNGDCESGLCGTRGDESRCTQNCSQNSDCPVGFECLTGGGACWPDDGTDPPPDDNPGDDDGEDDGPFSCLEGAVGSRGGTPGGGIALIAAVALAALRRRRRRE